MERIQQSALLRDLDKKMVLLVGPRQAGKTWLAKHIMQYFRYPMYLNYDQITDRTIIQQQSWLESTDLLILDECHKMPEWKNYLKGLYDTKRPEMRLLVTGSARLDVFDQLGDSLAGRYFRHRLLPLSLAELKQLEQPCDLQRLIERSGFPEPYLTEEIVDANRWRLQYINSLLSTDVFEFEQIHNVKAMRLLFELLRNRVGSPISYQSLAEDIHISPTTVKKYLEILEALYVIFRITPYSKNISRSLLKEPKIYFFDTGLVQGDDGAKCENLVANALLKHLYAKVDYLAEEYQLHYLRTKEGNEVDFVLVKEKNIEKIIEVKVSDGKPSKSLQYFHQKYQLPAIQVVKSLRQSHYIGEIKIVDVSAFLKELLL